MTDARSLSPILSVEHLKKSFGTHEVLKDISFDVRQGDVVSIIGSSGSGKSTLLRCINFLEQPTDGAIRFHGKNAETEWSRAQYHARVGMVFQSFNLFGNMSVLKNCMAGQMRVLHRGRREAEEKAMLYLEKVGMAPYRDARPAQLSGGQKQRVAIARALASDPEMLLCDEATSALDPMTTQSILALLQKINRELGITVVLITHEMAVIRQICNKVAILDGGELAEQGTVDDVFMHTKSAAGRRLFGILPDQEEIPPQPAIRIVFDGEAAERPVISKLVKDCGLEVNILSADIRQLNQKAYGQMMIARPQDPEDVKRVMDYLKAEGLTVEEVHVP